MTKNETQKLLKSLTLKQKRELLSFLVSLPSLESRVKDIEEELNIKLVGGIYLK